MIKNPKDLVLKYFKAVDDQDLKSILETMQPNWSNRCLAKPRNGYSAIGLNG